MKLLVTGGAGFLGSHLCEVLLDDGLEVICIDNLITGSLDNIEHLGSESRFHYVEKDVSEFIHVTGPVDAVMHFASPASPIDYLEVPIPTLKVGALGTHKALGLAKAKNATFVLASTSEVYGKSPNIPYRERRFLWRTSGLQFVLGTPSRTRRQSLRHRHRFA